MSLVVVRCPSGPCKSFFPPVGVYFVLFEDVQVL